VTPFDFSTQVTNGQRFPLFEKDFSFAVLIGGATATVDARGIYCWERAFLQLNLPENAVNLLVLNGGGTATITASDATGTTQSQNVVSSTIPQTVRFPFRGILRILFETNAELYLKMIS
jgi:hypothetical protein